MKRKCVFFWPPLAPPAGPPHESGGGYWPSYAHPPHFDRRYSLRSASILLQSSILMHFYHSIIDTTESASAQPYFLLLGRAAADPSTTAWLNPMYLGSKIDQPQRKVSVSGATAFRPPGHQLLLAPRPPRLSCGKGSSDVLDGTCVLCPVALSL